MSKEAEDLNRRLLRARDAMDRAYAGPLDVAAGVARRSSSFGEAAAPAASVA